MRRPAYEVERGDRLGRVSPGAHEGEGERTEEQCWSEAVRCSADVQELDHPVSVQSF